MEGPSYLQRRGRHDQEDKSSGGNSYFLAQNGTILPGGGERTPLVRIPVPALLAFVCGTPLVAGIVVVGLALTLHHKAATETHCRVRNWLPSLSAAVSGLHPELPIWRFLIGLHIGPRLILVSAYRGLYRRRLPSAALLRDLTAGLHLAEIFALLGLTTLAAHEHNLLHQMCTLAFLVLSLGHQGCSVLLFRGLRSADAHVSKDVVRSHELKLYLLKSSLLLTFAGTFFYARHTYHCETGVYSAFAATEYALIIANIAFHATAALDFRHAVLSVG